MTQKTNQNSPSGELEQESFFNFYRKKLILNFFSFFQLRPKLDRRS